jgi:MFS family permease
VFLTASILANIGGMMFYPILPLYLKELNADVGQIGLYFTLSMITPLALQIIGGWISDKIGRLRAVAIGSIGGSLGWIGVIFAPDWFWLLVANSVGSIAFAFVAPSYDAFIAEQSEEKDRGKVFAIVNTLYQVVGVIGPLAGGFVAKFSGWRALILIASSLYFAATAIRLWLSAAQASRARQSAPAETAERRESPLKLSDFFGSLKSMLALAASGGVITWLLLSDGVRDIAMGLSGNLLPVFLDEFRGIDVAALGTLNALFGVASMAVMIPAGHLADRKGERFSIAAGYLTAFAGFALLLSLPGPLTAGAGFLLFGAGVGMLQPGYLSLISKAVPERLRGIAFGFLSTSNGVVALPAPWLGSLLWASVAPIAPFWITAAVMIAIVPAVLSKFKLPSGSREAGAMSPAIEGPVEPEAASTEK